MILEPEAIIASDFDGDGDNDIAITGNDPQFHEIGELHIFRNNANGSFQGAGTYTVGGQPFGLCAGDFDGDGDNDLAVANDLSWTISILINNGDGTFQDPVNYNVGMGPGWVSACDLNGDGHIDLAVTNDFSNSVSLLLNIGDGTFQPAIDFGVGRAPESVFASDLDNDSDKDLAVVNDLSNNISILYNRTIISAINDEPSEILEAILQLTGYPNPFNSQITIQYSLSKQSMVTIDIFDILGRKIETITEGIKPAGDHQAIWEASDQSSGIYFYRIKEGDFVETRKMVLLK